MRGEFDPPEFMDNSERSSGLLLDSLMQFPTVRCREGQGRCCWCCTGPLAPCVPPCDCWAATDLSSA